MMLNTLKTFNYHKELVLTPLKTTMIASQNILPQKSRQLKKKSNSLQNFSAYATILTEFS